MAAKEISVKKYIVRLSGEERERLEALIRKGKSPAQRLLKARILLKAAASEAGEGWSDSRIIKALETSPSMIYRVRRQLVEEGFEAVLSRKQRATPAVARIFDGEKEAKLIALACSRPPKGRARWTLRLLENKVVELDIVDRDETGAPGPLRLRVRAQRHRQPLHDVCTARRLAPHQSHRSPYRRGLRSRLERLGRCPLLERQDHCSASGQSQHPQQGVTLRSLSGRRSQAVGRALRMALHSKARQLARSGGVRTRRPILPVPRPPHPRQTNPHRRNRRLGARPQCTPHQG